MGGGGGGVKLKGWKGNYSSGDVDLFIQPKTEIRIGGCIFFLSFLLLLFFRHHRILLLFSSSSSSFPPSEQPKENSAAAPPLVRMCSNLIGSSRS